MRAYNVDEIDGRPDKESKKTDVAKAMH